jgi:hypothetical protein
MTKVDRPGVYDIPIDDYHAQPCVGPSISASGLRTILLDSPAHYWAESSLNPNAEKADTYALRFGRAAHAFALGEPEFAKLFVISPYDEFRSNEAKDWRKAQTRAVLKAKELDEIAAMAASLRAQPSVAGAFQGGGKVEQSLIWQDEETGIWLKARPDWLPDDPAFYFAQEYKTAQSAEPGKASRQAFDLGYDMQAALALDGIRATMGVEPLGIAHVVQEKTAPYAASLLMFDKPQIEFGRKRYRAALGRFSECLINHLDGNPEAIAWPGYAQEPTYFQTPYWVAKAMQADQETNVNERTSRTAADYLSAY